MTVSKEELEGVAQFINQNGYETRIDGEDVVVDIAEGCLLGIGKGDFGWVVYGKEVTANVLSARTIIAIADIYRIVEDYMLVLEEN